MVSKELLVFFIVFAVLLSIIVTGMAIVKDNFSNGDDQSAAGSGRHDVGEGKVTFYVEEKLEPKTGNATVKFNVVKKR
ncbi:hypothetical protein HZB03_05540 [Candidatus Woesearchaeota archaeon]|nr:hypothetical protein [Candidatus Woesearchaeota archaeon]